jgi:3-oxoacyl-(acyl-carrier-protein) synthase
VVITGLGIVAPIGVGADAVWASVEAGRSGVRAVPELKDAGLPIYIAGDVADFDPSHSTVLQTVSLSLRGRAGPLGRRQINFLL